MVIRPVPPVAYWVYSSYYPGRPAFVTHDAATFIASSWNHDMDMDQPIWNQATPTKRRCKPALTAKGSRKPSLSRFRDKIPLSLLMAEYGRMAYGIHQKAHPTWHVSCWLDSEWSALIENPIKGFQKSDPKQGNPIGCPKSLSLCSMAPWKKPKPNTSIFEEYSLAHFKRRSLEVLTSAFFPAFKSFVPTLMKVMWSLVLSQLIVWRVVHPF